MSLLTALIAKTVTFLLELITDRKSSYQVRHILVLLCKLIVLILG